MKGIKRIKRRLRHLRHIAQFIYLFGLRKYIKFISQPFDADLNLNLRGHDIIIRCGTVDLKILCEIEFSEYNQVTDLSLSPSLIVDAGAHIGLAVIKLRSLYPTATIVALEPDEKNFSILKKNVESLDNVFLLQGALGSSRSPSKMNLNDRGTGNWGYSIVSSAAVDAKFSKPVKIFSLNDIEFKFGQKINFLKCDIEGGEYEILKHDAKLLHKIDAILIELHERIAPGTDAQFLTFQNRRKTNLCLGGEKYLTLGSEYAKQI